jgi:hypothetical protein
VVFSELLKNCGQVASVVTVAAAAGAAIFLVTMIGGFSTGVVIGIAYNQTIYEAPSAPNGTQTLGIIDYGTADLSPADLAHDSQLIVQGQVLHRKQGKTLPPPDYGMLGTPTVSHTIGVDKVIKGNPYKRAEEDKHN